jgi:hypothetical protein
MEETVLLVAMLRAGENSFFPGPEKLKLTATMWDVNDGITAKKPHREKANTLFLMNLVLKWGITANMLNDPGGEQKGGFYAVVKPDSPVCVACQEDTRQAARVLLDLAEALFVTDKVLGDRLLPAGDE